MKILLVSPKGNVSGGIARWTGHILQYYNSTDKDKCQLELFDTARSTFINDDISLLPRIRLAWKDYRSILHRLKSKLKNYSYDILHLTTSASYGLFKDLYILYYAKRKNIKTIIHFRFGRIPQLYKSNNWEWKLLLHVSRKANKIIVIDKQSYLTMQQAGFSNVSLLPNPLATELEHLAVGSSFEKRIPRTILFVGHCIRPKGVYELVEACCNISNIKLKLVGAIKEDVKRDLLTMSRNASWLKIAGEQPYEKVMTDMLQCDIFVLPTYTEGFPNVILEAMACGCAIVTTPVGAIPEMLEEEDGKKYGIMISPKNVAQLQQAIKTMLSDTILKESCKSNVKERVITRYSMPKVWERLMTIWYQLSDIQ